LHNTIQSKVNAMVSEIEILFKNRATKKFIADRYNSTSAGLHNWINKIN